MTPVQIEVALHYYYCGSQMERDCRAVEEAHNYLHGHGLLVHDSGEYQGTDKLEAYLEALMDVKLPVISWVVPE